MSTATTSERVRLTISVPVEVHAAFTRLAAVSGGSLSKEIGDFLAETVEAVDYTASKMEQARDAPRLAMREMHAFALGLADETGQVLQAMRGHGAAARASGAVTAAERSAARTSARRSPPSSNTGGKVPPAGGKKRRPTRGTP